MYKKALIIGIDNYPGKSLTGCKNDAELVNKLITSEFSSFTSRLLLDSEATRSRIRKEINWLLTDADVSFLYFAGHGWKGNISTYLVSYDYEPDDEGIDLEWLASAPTKIASTDQTVIYVLDCCHSGDGTVRSFSKEKTFSAADLPPINGRGRVLLAACGGTEESKEITIDGITHGLFTHHFCSALSGAASNSEKKVTINAIFDYIGYQMRNTPTQTPVMKGDQSGIFYLAEGVTKQGDWMPTSQETIDEAIHKAEQFLSQTHHALNRTNSIELWKSEGHLETCQTFSPTLNWFRRKIEANNSLLTIKNFKTHYNTCQHFLARLCSIDEDIKLSQGTIGSRIGSGSFGTVWKVKDSIWNQAVCFKVFHPHDLNDKEKVARFRRGYDAMTQLDHPNIVKVLDLCELPFGFFMQYIEGANLRAFNPGHSSEPEAIVDILITIAETLKHAHGRGVIHRDVKPENILLRFLDDGSADAYLTDFDLAWFSTATQVTQVAGFGSHFYAAPEQMDAPQANASHQTTVDTYSFGQLCFFAICGRDPLAFNHEGNIKALSEELGKKWNNAEASKEMLSLFDNTTKHRPSERVQDFRGICDALARIRASISNVEVVYSTKDFLEQLRFNLSGDIRLNPIQPPYATFRSRSGQTEIFITIMRESDSHCEINATLRPDQLIMQGHNSADVRTVINQRIDSVLAPYVRDHNTERRGAKAGAFETNIRIKHIQKKIEGILKAREIISRVIDVLEQA